MKKPIIISTLALAGIYLGILAVRQYNLIQKSCYEVFRYKLQNFGLNYAKIKITFKVKNATDVGFVIHKQAYKVFINNYEVANILTTEDMKLPAQSEVYPSIEVEFSPKQFIKSSLSELLKTGSKTNIRVVGKLSLKSGILFYNNIEVDTTTTLYEVLNDTSETTPC